MTEAKWLEELKEIYEGMNESYKERKIVTHQWSNIGENDPSDVCTSTRTYIDLWNGKFIDKAVCENIIKAYKTSQSRANAFKEYAKTLDEIIEDCKMDLAMEREDAENEGIAKDTDINGYIVFCNGMKLCEESCCYK